MAIRYDKKLNQEISRTVSNFNRKITRLQNKGIDIDFGKIKTKDLKKYDNRKELRRELIKLKRFTKRGSEEVIQLKSGHHITKWELDTIKIEKRRATRIVNKSLHEMESKRVKILGKVQDVTFASMGSQEYLNLKAKKKAILNKDILSLDKRGIERFENLLSNITDVKTDDNIRENFIEILENTGYMVGFDSQKMKVIIDELNVVSNFKDLIDDDKGLKTIFNYYELLKMPTYKDDGASNDLFSLLDNLFENIGVIVNEYK